MLDGAKVKNYVEVYIWRKAKPSVGSSCSATEKGHISLQLFKNGEADTNNYLSFFPKTSIAETLIEEGKILSVTPGGAFESPDGDNYIYEEKSDDLVGIKGRRECEIKKIYGLDIEAMERKIMELKKRPLKFHSTGSSLVALGDYRNCAGAVSEVLHAGGIKKFFLADQIKRTAISNILSCLSIFGSV